MLPSLPKPGSAIESFLQWENEAIAALGNSNQHHSVWACWQANEGVCITAKEKRFADFDIANETFQQQGLEVAVRRSGGTTVPHGDGVLAITHIAKSSGPKDISRAYLGFCSHIQNVLSGLGFNTHVGAAIGAYCDGDYNVLIDGVKLAGTSQRWTRAGRDKTEIILNHAVLLVSNDSAKATQRVNEFHQLAEQRVPFDEEASTSLWEAGQLQSSNHEIKDLNEHDFFNLVFTAFQTYQPNKSSYTAPET